MKIDICSDMHIDHWWHTTKVLALDGPKTVWHDGSALYVDWAWYRENVGGGDVLIIAGDLSNSIEVATKSLLHASEVYRYVVYVDGNHEHYNKMPYSRNMVDTALACAMLPNVVFLSSDSPVFTVEHVAFVGANGWYDWQCYASKGISKENGYGAWKGNLNDYPMIRFDEGDPSILAATHANALAAAVAGLQSEGSISNIVLATHSCPRVDLVEWRNLLAWDMLTPSFVNSQMLKVLDADKGAKISNWIYGHTHTRNDRIINGVRYLNNCRGYPRELDVWQLRQFEV